MQLGEVEAGQQLLQQIRGHDIDAAVRVCARVGVENEKAVLQLHQGNAVVAAVSQHDLAGISVGALGQLLIGETRV